MSPLLLLLSFCLPGQNCITDTFPEWLLWPIDRGQKGGEGIAVDSRGSFIALTQYCRALGCPESFKGHLLDCENTATFQEVTIAGLQPQLSAAVSKAPNGNFLVVWDNDHCVFSQAFDRRGLPLAEKEILYPDSCGVAGSNGVYHIELARDREGNHIVAWDQSRIRVRKLGSLGQWLGHEFLIDAFDYPDIFTSSNLKLGALCVSESGRILIVGIWRPRTVTDRPHTYVFWLLDSDLRLVRQPVVVTKSSYFGAQSNGPCAGVDAEGNFTVAWRMPGQAWLDGGAPHVKDQILAQRFTKEGEPVGPEIEVSGPPIEFSQFNPPHVVMSTDGRFAVIWCWPKRGITVGQRFTRDGERVGRLIEMNVLRPATIHSVATDHQNLLAVQYFLGSGSGLSTVAARVIDLTAQEFIRGDANESGAVDISDAIAILEYLFLGGEVRPVVSAADTNDDGRVELTDALHVLWYLFVGGRDFEIPHPFPMWGFDPTPNEG